MNANPMQEVSLMKRRRSSSRRTPTPTPTITTTGAKRTFVKDPRAAARFSLDDAVSWDEDDRLVPGVIVGFADECTARVRVEDGSIRLWPTVSARFKRLQTEDFEEEFTEPDAGSPTLRTIDEHDPMCGYGGFGYCDQCSEPKDDQPDDDGDYLHFTYDDPKKRG